MTYLTRPTEELNLKAPVGEFKVFKLIKSVFFWDVEEVKNKKLTSKQIFKEQSC